MLETNTLKKMKRFTAIPKSLIIVTGDVGYGCLTPQSYLSLNANILSSYI
jgi:hypothetical protein